VEFAVFLHESRALTEGKERDAEVLVPVCDSEAQELNTVAGRS
jgi:hypothetical protein